MHGPQSVLETGKVFKDLGARRCLVVTDKGVRRAGLIDGVLRSLKESDIPYVVFDDVEEDPSGATVGRGADLAVKNKCDGIVVVGGGSPICAGRGIGVVVNNGGHIRDYEGLNKASKPPLPLIAIPTTAGSGAEVSQFIILRDEDRQMRMVAGSPLYFPKWAILDPMLLKTLSPWQFTVSGVDALAHAIEAYLTTMTTPITDALALSSVKLIHDNLRAAATSDDLDAKEACLIGSTMANMACGNARLGLVHALTSPMESLYEIPHGVAVGTFLPYVMEFNLPASQHRFATLAKCMGQCNRSGSSGDVAGGAVLAVKKLYIDLSFPRKYSTSQVDRKSIPQMVTMAMTGLYGKSKASEEYPLNRILSSVNIRKATMQDAIDLLEKAFEGWELPK